MMAAAQSRSYKSLAGLLVACCAQSTVQEGWCKTIYNLLTWYISLPSGPIDGTTVLQMARFSRNACSGFLSRSLVPTCSALRNSGQSAMLCGVFWGAFAPRMLRSAFLYSLPPMLAHTKPITFCVSVPVLSLRTYCTCEKHNNRTPSGARLLSLVYAVGLTRSKAYAPLVSLKT